MKNPLYQQSFVSSDLYRGLLHIQLDAATFLVSFVIVDLEIVSIPVVSITEVTWKPHLFSYTLTVRYIKDDFSEWFSFLTRQRDAWLAAFSAAHVPTRESDDLF